MADELDVIRDLGRDIAEPSSASVERARGLLRRRIEAAGPSHEHRRRSPSVRWMVAGAVVVLLASGFGFGLGTWVTPPSNARTPFYGLGFLPTPGWTVVQSETAAPAKSSSAVVSNVQIDAADRSSELPHATLRRLPPRGIVIVARLSPRGDERVDSRFPARTLPLRLRDAVPAALPPTLARTALVPVRIRAGVDGFNADVTVFFGTAPSSDMIAAVDRQLRGLVFAAAGVTLVVSPRIVRSLSERLSIFGSVSSGKANEKVTIQFKQCGLNPVQFRDRLETTTREGGGYSFGELGPFNPGSSGVFRAQWRDSVSAEVPVQQRASVSLRTEGGGRFRVYVSAQVQLWRRKVLLQRFERARGSWITARSLLLTESLGGGSSPTVTIRTALFRPALPKGTTIRAVLPLSQARPCYLAGYSELRRT